MKRTFGFAMNMRSRLPSGFAVCLNHTYLLQVIHFVIFVAISLVDRHMLSALYAAVVYLDATTI